MSKERKGLELDFSGGTVVIDSSHEVFTETAFANAEFHITVQPLSHEDAINIREKHTRYVRGNPRPNEAAITRNIFMRCVIGWDGIYARNKDGKVDLLPYSEENKMSMAERQWQFASAIAAACVTPIAGEVSDDPEDPQSETGN